MSKEIFIQSFLNAILSGAMVLLLFYFGLKAQSKEKPTKKLYFEFRKKDNTVTADGFLRYNGKWCPIVLNDSIAIIYE
jgi:hypothetical protein